MRSMCVSADPKKINLKVEKNSVYKRKSVSLSVTNLEDKMT